MVRTDDPYGDFLKYTAEQEDRLEELPHCTECGEPIVDDYCYEIDDEILCKDCLDFYYQKHVEDVLER